MASIYQHITSVDNTLVNSFISHKKCKATARGVAQWSQSKPRQIVKMNTDIVSSHERAASYKAEK